MTSIFQWWCYGMCYPQVLRSSKARLLWEQEVGGSNPLTPTRQKPLLTDMKPFFIEGLLFCHIGSGKVTDIHIGDTDLGDTVGDTPRIRNIY